MEFVLALSNFYIFNPLGLCFHSSFFIPLLYLGLLDYYKYCS